MSIRKSINFIARKILYAWIKTEILPANPAELNIRADVPAIYVVEARAWSNLLVLQAECERLGLSSPLNRISVPQLDAWHCVYTIAPRQPFKAWLNKLPKRSRMLRGIVEILHDQPEQEIQFIPVSVFWGRPIATQKHWLQVLFADSWQLAGGLRKFFTILFHGRNTTIKFSEPIMYQDGLINRSSNDAIVDRLQFMLASRLTDVRIATLGPDISHRRTLVRKLLQKRDVKKAVLKRANEDNRSEYQATLQARRYLREILANCTNITIQIMQRGLSTFWNRFYSGIDISHEGELKKLALSHGLIYVPCHRSHIDYLLLSYVIYFQGLAIPYIAAGKNLNMPVIGTILRGGGAFFIRRSFKGNELYSTMMFEYIAELISKGVPIEYFIEGGRSRTGRLLQPKPGMLAMSIRGFLKYRKKPVAFIPVYIGYEKLLESKAYQAELSGEDKKAETFFNSIKSILRIRGNYGKVHTNFGKPVFLNKILDYQHPTWLSENYDDASRPPWVREIVDSVALTVMQRINQAATVNAVNLISTALLGSHNQSMDEQGLCDLLEIYRSLILAQHCSGRIIVTKKNPTEQIQHAERLKLVKRRRHELGDIIYLDNKTGLSMTYYRNNILHLMALPSMIACCFINKQAQTKNEVLSLVSLAYPFIHKELFLTWELNQLPDIVDQTLNHLCKQKLLYTTSDNRTFSKHGSTTIQFTQLNLLAKIISPILEVYYLTLALLSRTGPEKVPKKELERKCQLMAQRIAMMHELNSPDFSDIHLISNFINTLINIDYVTVFETEKLAYSELFQTADKRIRLLINKDMRSKILQMLKRVE